MIIIIISSIIIATKKNKTKKSESWSVSADYLIPMPWLSNVTFWCPHLLIFNSKNTTYLLFLCAQEYFLKV